MNVDLLTQKPGEWRLHLGCGATYWDGWVNCDLYPGIADLVFDLMDPWPLQDGSVDYIHASHVLEHLPDGRRFFAEAWRVLKADGTMTLQLPYGGHSLAWCDLEHQRPWFPGTFCFLQPGYGEAIRNPQHDGWDYPFGVEVVVRLSVEACRLLRHKKRWVRDLIRSLFAHLGDMGVELIVTARPLKDLESQGKYRANTQPNCMTVRYGAYKHDWEGRPLRPGEAGELVILESDERGGACAS